MNICTLTKAQRKVLVAKWKDSGEPNFQKFVDTAYMPIGCDGAVAVDWNGMQLLIERDGYCHS